MPCRARGEDELRMPCRPRKAGEPGIVAAEAEACLPRTFSCLSEALGVCQSVCGTLLQGLLMSAELDSWVSLLPWLSNVTCVMGGACQGALAVLPFAV